MEIIIGIGECVVSNNEKDILKTFSLGSCVALTMYSLREKVLGMVHIPLPASVINSVNGKKKPGYYVDTAIPYLLDIMINKHDCKKNELIANIFGGADSPKQKDFFKIGERNVKAVKSLLAQNFIFLQREDTGGAYSRNVEADVATGTIKLGKLCLNELKRIPGN